jgi:NAD(P)-dependent dehydrogenase (short-subunit alcohol dehydrogenase family)
VQDFEGKVAVVTGAASGMGLAFAHRFAEAGMNVVLADIEAEPLAMAEAAVSARGVRALAVRTNVIEPQSVERLADEAFRAFGNVHVVCNNAGVAAGGLPSWESRLEDWEWVLGVNFWGVLHGIRAFVPRMLENGDEGHVVNTASMAGLVWGGNAYGVSKHAVVVLTEGLYGDLKTRGTRLSASVLCPGWVDTNILTSQRNRPEEFGDALAEADLPDGGARLETIATMLKGGYPPAQIAEDVFAAVRDDRFWITPAQPNFFDLIRERMENILSGENPVVRPYA